MREKISVYVDELFSDAALTIRNAEVQQEILQHTLDRYDDLIAAGNQSRKRMTRPSAASATYRSCMSTSRRRKNPKSGIFLRRLHRTRYPLRRRAAGRKSSPAGPSRSSAWVQS